MFTKKEVREIVDAHGGPAAIIAGLRAFGKRVERMQRAREELIEKYPNRWVSILDDGQICVGDSLEQVMAEVESKGQRPAETVIEYLDPDPPMMIV